MDDQMGTNGHKRTGKPASHIHNPNTHLSPVGHHQVCIIHMSKYKVLIYMDQNRTRFPQLCKILKRECQVPVANCKNVTEKK